MLAHVSTFKLFKWANDLPIVPSRINIPSRSTSERPQAVSKIVGSSPLGTATVFTMPDGECLQHFTAMFSLNTCAAAQDTSVFSMLSWKALKHSWPLPAFYLKTRVEVVGICWNGACKHLQSPERWANWKASLWLMKPSLSQSVRSNNDLRSGEESDTTGNYWGHDGIWIGIAE
jgi:hypothetical protein